MKSFDERFRTVIEQGDAILETRKKRRAVIRRTVCGVAGVCAAAAIGFGIRNSALNGALTPDPDDGYVHIEETTSSTTTVSAASTTTAETTAITTSATSVDSTSETSAQSTTQTSSAKKTAPVTTSSGKSTSTSTTTRSSSTSKTSTTTKPSTTTSTTTQQWMTTTTVMSTRTSTYTIPASTKLVRTITYFLDDDVYYYYNMGHTVPTTAVDTELGTTPTGYQHSSAVCSIKNTLPDTALAVRDDDGSYILFCDLFRFYTSPEGRRYKSKNGGPVYEGDRQFLRTEQVIESVPEIGYAYAYPADIYTVNGISPDVLLGIKTEGTDFINAYYGGLDSPKTLGDICDALAVRQYITYVTNVNVIYDEYILEYGIKSHDRNKEFFDTLLFSEPDLPVTKTPPEIHSDRIMQTYIQLGAISFSIKVEITEDGWMTLDMLGDKYYCLIGSEKFTEYENYLKENSNVYKRQKYY